MIVCPNCKHENPQGATNCEACYTALPATKACPACGASMQLDATFCGQCGHNLKPASQKSAPIFLPPPATSAVNSESQAASIGLPPTVLTSPALDILAVSSDPQVAPTRGEIPPTILDPVSIDPILPSVQIESEPVVEEIVSEPEIENISIPVSTKLQTSVYQLLHLQTNTILEIPPHLQVVNLGKPNDQIAPDIDVSPFPCAEVVSRIHANIQIDGDNYYIEDVGSANGTYINHNVLSKGNRHLLRTGDRIGLGKGDLVTFLFQSSIR